MSVIQYDNLSTLTGGGSLSIQLASNGTDTIYWCHTGGVNDVFQYEIGVGTTNLGDPGDYPATRGAGLVCFGGDLYQMRYNSDISDVHIYKWDGAVWSTVYTPVNDPSTFFSAPGLWASDNLMVAIIPGDAPGGRPCVYSIDGSSWVQGKVNGSTSTRLYEVFNKGSIIGYPGRGNSKNVGDVYAELTLTNNNSSDGRTRIYKFDETLHDWIDQQGVDWGFDWAPPGTSPNDSIRYLNAAPDRHWKVDGGSYYYTSNFTSWTLAPDGGTIEPIYQLGMPYTCAYYKLPVANTNYIYAWWNDMMQWVQIAYHEQQPTYGDPFAVVSLNGIMYLLTKSGSNNRILDALNARGRIPLNCIGSNRLWIYKLASSGITSRGVIVTTP